MEIVFIRHTEKEETGEDPYLTKRGIVQAGHIAQRLKKEKFEEFYCSNLNRAKQTAGIISEAIGIKPKIKESLNEFESETLKKDKAEWIDEEKGHYYELTSFLKNIAKKPDEKKLILIVAHGITNRIILSHFLGLDLKKLIQFRQAEGGLNSIYWAEKFKNWRLQIWNDNNHLPEGLRYTSFSYSF